VLLRPQGEGSRSLFTEDLGENPGLLWGKPQPQEVSLELGVRVVLVLCPRVEDGVVVDELHVSRLENHVQADILPGRQLLLLKCTDDDQRKGETERKRGLQGAHHQSHSLLQLGGVFGELLKPLGGADKIRREEDAHLIAVEIEDRHGVVGLLSGGNFALAVVIHRAGKQLSQVRLEPEQLVIDGNGAGNNALAPASGGLQAEESNNVAKVNVKRLSRVCGVDACGGELEVVTKVFNMAEKVSLGVLGSWEAKVAANGPVCGCGLLDRVFMDGEALYKDEAVTLEDLSLDLVKSFA